MAPIVGTTPARLTLPQCERHVIQEVEVAPGVSPDASPKVEHAIVTGVQKTGDAIPRRAQQLVHFYWTRGRPKRLDYAALRCAFGPVVPRGGSAYDTDRRSGRAPLRPCAARAMARALPRGHPLFHGASWRFQGRSGGNRGDGPSCAASAADPCRPAQPFRRAAAVALDGRAGLRPSRCPGRAGIPRSSRAA